MSKSIRTTLTMQEAVHEMALAGMTQGKFRSLSLYLEDLVIRHADARANRSNYAAARKNSLLCGSASGIRKTAG
jgi:hypothetical protein